MAIENQNTTQLIDYKGPFCMDILSCFGNIIRQMLIEYPKSSIRLYKLFFELAQNVAKYSVEKSNINNCRYSGIGHFTLEETFENYILKTSNHIYKNDGAILQNYCNEINTMDKDGLLKFRSQKRNETPNAKDMGAQIGIIQIGLLTHAKIQFEITELSNNLATFTIWATILKEH